jgi:hypothetical protein
MDIQKTNNSAITVLSNMQCLLDIFRQFPQNQNYDEVIFKSVDEFHKYIYHIDIRPQDIVFSHTISPVKMYIQTINMSDIFKNQYIYDLSTVETEELIEHLKKIIIIEETDKYKIEKQTIDNTHFIKQYEMSHFDYKNKQLIKKSVNKYIEYLLNDKKGVPPKDYDIFEIYKTTNKDNKKYIISKIVNIYNISHLFFNSQLENIIDNNNDDDIYKHLWLQYYH